MILTVVERLHKAFIIFCNLVSFFHHLTLSFFRWPVNVMVTCPAWGACWIEGWVLAELRVGPIRFTAYWPQPMANWLRYTRVPKQVHFSISGGWISLFSQVPMWHFWSRSGMIYCYESFIHLSYKKWVQSDHFAYLLNWCSFGRDRWNGAVRRSRSGAGISLSWPIRSPAVAAAPAQIHSCLPSTQTHTQVKHFYRT